MQIALPMVEDHLARQRQADLFLDTLNYNAHTTASDALWAGVPVVTCLGSTFAGRVAASQLRAVGLAELVTESLPDYEAVALKISTDLALCPSLKDRLARDRKTVPAIRHAALHEKYRGRLHDDVAARSARRSSAELRGRPGIAARLAIGRHPAGSHFARVQVCDLQRKLMTQPLRSAVLSPVMVNEPV